MTVTVKDLIAYLETQDQDAIVDIVVCKETGGYYNTAIPTVVKFDIEKHIGYTDLRGNQFIDETDSRYNKRYLTFGDDF